MSYLVTDPADLIAFKQRWLHQTDRSRLDKAIVPAPVTWSLHPGIAPVWSCASHPGTESNRLYITAAVSAQGAEALAMLHERYWMESFYPDGYKHESNSRFHIGLPNTDLKCSRLIRIPPLGSLDSKGSPFWRGMSWETHFSSFLHRDSVVKEHIDFLDQGMREIMKEQGY